MDFSLISNVTWHTLNVNHRKFAVGAEHILRYAPGFSPIIGFEDPTSPDLASLEPYCIPGEHFYCDGWSGPTPKNWSVQFETPMLKMVFKGPPPCIPEIPNLTTISASYCDKAMELVELTKPGPFGRRTIEIGEYVGIFEDGKLVAMAGERFYAGEFRELSGICTHPDFRGKGYAKLLSQQLIINQLSRGETPFLNVLTSNVVARKIYEKLGFEECLETTLRVVRFEG